MYIHCNKSSDQILQRDSYSGHKSRHLVKMMNLVLVDGYADDLRDPFYGKKNDVTVTQEILHIFMDLSTLCHNDLQIVE